MPKSVPVNSRMFLVPNDGDYNDLVLVTGAAMLKANEGDLYTVKVIQDLKPGQTAYVGGGAAADFFITRVDGITAKTKNSKYNPLAVHKEYQRVTFEGEGHAKVAKEFAAIVGGRVQASTLSDATWVVLDMNVEDAVHGVAAKVEKLFDKAGLSYGPETGQEMNARYFRGAGRTKIAREFVKALGKGKYPISIGFDATYVDLSNWPDAKPFPRAVGKVFRQFNVEVHD